MSLLKRIFAPPNVLELKSKGDIKGLIKALRYKKDVEVRRAAVGVLAEMGDAAAVNPLVSLFKDDNFLVQQSAQYALVRIGEPALQTLVPAILGEVGGKMVRPAIAHMRVLSCAEETLVKFGSRAVKPLLEVLADSLNHNTHVASALGRIGDQRAVMPLVQLLTDGSGSKRWTAAKTLGQLKAASAVQPLITALQDHDLFVRKYAAEALGLIGDSRAVGPLNAILNDTDEEVRKAVSSALVRLGVGVET